MIKSFGSLFAGRVDLEQKGLDGTSVNERWLSDEYLATVFHKAEAIATLMDRLRHLLAGRAPLPAHLRLPDA